jgi:septum site-determining protein MinC
MPNPINPLLRIARRAPLSIAVQPQPAIRFRGRSFLAFALTPEPPVADWLGELDKWTRNSPGFFLGKPVILDLAQITLSEPAIGHLIGQLSERGVRVMGLEGIEPSAITSTRLPPVLLGGRSGGEGSGAVPAQVAELPAPAKRPEATSLVLEDPIRSGQSVIFPFGDVTVLGSVASGSEVVAGGSIHVYGTLRGRAMAGVNGFSNARIFCQKIEAELLAIDGFYQTAEDIDVALRGGPAQAWLQGNTMRITALN